MTTGSANATFPTELVAEYTPLYAINVTANGPCQLTLTPADFAGRTSTPVPYAAEYILGSNVTLTASASNSNNDVFDHWELDGVRQPTGQLALTINNLASDRNAQVVYRRLYYGNAIFHGFGCPGSNGVVPSMQITAFGTGLQVGAPADYDLFSAWASTPVSLVLGLGDTAWGSVTLPLDLGRLGAAGCFLRHDPVVMFPASTTVSGTTRVTITWPNDPALVRSVHYASWVVIDPANTLGAVVSDSWAALLGGWQ